MLLWQVEMVGEGGVGDGAFDFSVKHRGASAGVHLLPSHINN